MAIEFDLIAAISETTKITALLLASITFILNQYLKEHENHAPCRRLIL